MSDKQLSIKVKVNLPTAGEIERKLNHALDGMKDIKADVKISPKIGKIGNLKKEIRRAIGNEKIRVGLKVAGTSELKQLANQVRTIRRLADKPIQLKVDTSAAGIDKAIEKASREVNAASANSHRAATSSRISNIEAEKRELRELRDLYKDRNKAEENARKHKGTHVGDTWSGEYERLGQEIATREQQLKEQARSYGRTVKEMEASIRRTETSANRGHSIKMATINASDADKQAKRVIKGIKDIIREQNQLRLQSLSAGPRESAWIDKRVADLDRLKQKYLETTKFTAAQSREMAAFEEKANSNFNLRRARMSDAARGRGGRRRSGITNTMDVWSMLQTGAFAAAGAVSQLNEVDKAITKVTKVVPDSQRAVNRWKKNIYKDASEVGKTAPEFASAVEQWATAGYNLKRSNALAKASVMGSFVGEVPVDDMVKYMSVPMKAFQKEGLKSKDIINAMNLVSNNHAIEMNDLGAAYQKASSTVAATGTNFSQLTGIITAAQEGTRAGGDVIGVAFKTIGSRIAKMGTGLTKQDKTRAAFFKHLGVDLTDSQGQLKSTWQVMDQLGKKWDHLSKKDKNTAAQYAAGANHANVFQATLDNWKTARKAMQESQGQVDLVDKNHGSAYQEFAKQKKSIQFHLAQMQNSWSSFLSNIMGGREGTNQMIDMVNDLAQAAAKLTSNSIVSRGIRWGAITAGIVMARHAISGLIKSFASIGGVGSKLDAIVAKMDKLAASAKKADKDVEDLGRDLKHNDTKEEPKEKSAKDKKRHKDEQEKEKHSSESGPKVVPEGVTNGNYQGMTGGNTTINNTQKTSEAHEKLGKTVRKETKANNDNAASLSSIANAATRSGQSLAKTGKDTEKAATKVGRFGRIVQKGTTALSLLGSGLGYLGIAMDAVTIAGGVMEMMGIHPLKILGKVMDATGGNARRFSSYIDKVGGSVERTSRAIDKNGLVTGQLNDSVKSVAQMKDALGSLQTSGGKYVGDKFESLMKNYNKIAKSNGLELRIKGTDSIDAVNSKIRHLDQDMKQVTVSDAQDLSKKMTKQVKNVGKLLNPKSLRKLVQSTSSYKKELEKLRRKYKPNNGPYSGDGRQLATTGKANYGDPAAYKRAVKRLEDKYFSPGHGNAQMWATSAGKKILSAVHQAQVSFRKGVDSYAASLADGTLTPKNISTMDPDTQRMASLGAIKNLRDLQDASDSDQKGARDTASAILKGLGISKGSINKIVSAAADKYQTGNLFKGLASTKKFSDEELANIAGVGAIYQSQHKDWKKRIGQQSTKMDKYRKYHPNAVNADMMIDPNTGYAYWDKIAKLDNTAAYGAKGRRLRAVGVNKKFDEDKIAQATTGLDGDPFQILNNIAKGKGTVEQIAAVTSNNHKKWDGGKVTGPGATGQQIVQAVAAASNGKKNLTQSEFTSGIQQALDNGEISQKQADDAEAYHRKNFTKYGNAKTIQGAKDKIGDRKSITAGTFDEITKGFKKKNGKADKAQKGKLAEELRRAGKLSKKAYDQLRHDKKIKARKDPTKDTKKNKPKSTNSKDNKNKNKRNKDGKLEKKKPLSHRKTSKDGSEKSSSHKPRNTGKNPKNAAPKAGSTLASAYNPAIAKSLSKLWNGSLFKGFKMPNFGKLFKGFKMPNFSKMFKGFKMPNFSKMFKKVKLPNFGKMFKKFKMPNFSKMFKGFGKGNPFSKLFGKGKKPKVKVSADTKDVSKSLSKLGKGKGHKVKLQADTKALTKSMDKLGKGKGHKVKLQADTKSLSKSMSKLGKGKGQKVKLQADTKALSKSISKVGKGKKAKVKVTADTKSLSGSIKKAAKGKKAKVKVTADTSAAKSKIKSLTSSLKGSSKAKVKVTASVSGLGKVKSLKSALNGLKDRNVSVTASCSGAGKVKSLKRAINGVHDKSVSVKASVSGTGRVRALKRAINGVHSKSVKVTAHVSGTGAVHSLASAIASVHSKSVTVSVTKTETTIKKSKNGSVAIADIAQGANPLKSMSVVAQDPKLLGIINASASSLGVDANAATNGQKVTDYSDSTQKVDENYWRYMGNELYTGLPLDEQVSKLESTVTQADQDMDKLINLSRQRIDIDKKQIEYQQTMQRAYQQQINDVLGQLHGYGFRTSGNRITNLDHAKQITGDNASKVDDLLGKYQSAYQNYSAAVQKIAELQTDIWQQGKNQEDYRNTKDQKMVEKLQRSLEILTTAVDNHKNIMERQAESLGENDYIMRTNNSANQITTKMEDVYQLLQKFNEMSLSNFVGTKDADNAKNLLDSMQSIRDTVTETLDSVDELKKSIRDDAINAIINNIERYTDNLNDSIDRLQNNVTNLQDGLLSGSDYSDLMSSNFDAVNLTQRSAYEKSVNDRIALEQQLDDIMDKFAQKNVDRTAQVANQELQINYEKYEELTKMADGFANNRLVQIEPIRGEYESLGKTDQMQIPGVDHNKEFVEASVRYQQQMNDLKSRYNTEMEKANLQEERQAINQQMVFEQLKLQEQVYKEMISADQRAISDLKKQQANPDMTTEQLQTITDKITEYEKNIIDAQNGIKEAVKSRYEYEKTLIDKEIDDYQRLSDTMGNLVTIADALHLDGETQAKIIGQQYAATYMQYDNYLNILARLREEMSHFEKGSFERNQLEEMIKDYKSSLDSTVTSLLDINKSEFEQKLNAIQEAFEKSVNKGMTADQAKFDQDVWYNPMQKELKLEEMRLKIVELEDKTVEKRIAALDAQERMSKAEADYVDKQLDLALAQQKLNNTINKKDVRYLEKDENGKFNWTYIADQDSVDAARQEVNQAKQALEDAKVSNRNDYIEKVEEIVSDAKDGKVNQEEVRKRLEQLNDSYKFILKDIPTFDISKVEDILKAYNEYEERNRDVINDYRKDSTVAHKSGYEDIVKGFGEQFKAVSKDLGEIFGKELRATLNLPNGIRNPYGNGTDNSFVIHTLNLELPNVRDGEEFAKAIETLPQVAQQYATRK